MTVDVSRLTRLFFALLVLIISTSACGGCDDEGDGEASVTIDALVPEDGYPGVEVEVSFSIAPGANTSADGMSWRVDFGDGTQTSGSGVNESALHAFEFAGEYEITVQAVFDGATVGSSSVPYRVFAPVDLTASNLRGAPANVRTGDDLTASLDIANAQAADVQTNFDVRVYFSQSRDISDLSALPVLGTLTVQAQGEGAPVVLTGETRNIGVTAPVAAEVASGDYFLVGVIDPEEKVGDIDRTNNLIVSDSIVRVENVSDTSYDLTVEELLVVPDRAFPTLNTVTRGFTLANRGNVDAFDVVHKTYLSIGDSSLDDADTLIATSEPTQVFAGDRITIAPSAIVLDDEIIPPAGQPIQVWVIVTVESEDTGGEESNPDNNVALSDPPITVSDEPVEGPDIVVRSFSVAPTSTFLNGTLEIQTTLANEGTLDVGSFFCAIYLGATSRVNTQQDPRLDNINLPTLASGSEIELERTITVPGLYDPGTYFLYIVCDPTNALSEPFRSNNSMVFPEPITITDEADVDLYVESFTVPAAINEGDAFDATVKLCVAGTNPSGATTGKLYRSAGGSVQYTGTPLVELDLPNVNPGECEEITVPLTASCDDFLEIYTYGIAVDTAKVLPETDEDNNERRSNQQTVAGTYCACNEDSYEPNDRSLDATPLTTGTYDAAICTSGTCDFYAFDLQANDSLVVTNTFAPEKGSLVTGIFDSSATQQLDVSSVAGVQEVATFLVPQSGLYYVRVCGSTASDRNYYSLDARVFTQSGTIDVIPRDVTIPTRSQFSVGATMDVGVRIYNLGVQEATTFDARVVATPNLALGDGDDVTLANVSAGPVPAGSFRDLTIPATLPQALVDGDYYIAVVLDPLAQLAESDTSNNAAFSNSFTVARECYDPLEPNDNFLEARTLTAGTYANLIACTSAGDFYRFCPNDAQEFTATVTFDETQGDIDLYLHDENTVQIDSSAGVGGIEQVSVDYVNGSRCFYLQTRVQALPGQTVELSYELDLEIKDVDPTLRCDGVFESNDAFATASSLVAATTGSLTLDRCPETDTDIYYVDLASGQRVDFSGTLAPANQAGTLRLQLYLPSQAPGPNAESGPGVPTAEIKDYVAPRSGRFYLQVTVSGTQRNVTYNLATSGLGGVDLTPVNFVIGPGTYSAGDEVRFSFDMQNLGSDLAAVPAYAVYFGTTSTLDVGVDSLLLSSASTDVAGNTSASLTGRVNVPVDATDGTRYLHIVADPADVLMDTNRSNNIVSIPVTIAP